MVADIGSVQQFEKERECMLGKVMTPLLRESCTLSEESFGGASAMLEAWASPPTAFRNSMTFIFNRRNYYLPISI